MWQELVRPHVEAGRLVAIGVVQEQHPDRAALYAQWRELDWPIYVDSLNALGLRVVPVPMGLDANGIVREPRLSRERFEHFLETEYPAIDLPEGHGLAERPDLDALHQRAEERNEADAWVEFATASFHFGEREGALTPAIEGFERAIALEPEHGIAHFRLGVALRRRSESEHHRPGDAQAAIDHWMKARAIDPNQYIWLRRVQQYGPRLMKPYNFYFWVDEARREIRERGDVPHPLREEPMGSEVLGRKEGDSEGPRLEDRDPEGRITRDTKGLVNLETMVTPHPVEPGGRVRLRLTFRLNEEEGPSWNDEAAPLSVYMHSREGFELGEGSFVFQAPEATRTREVRHLEFEISVGEEVSAGVHELRGYALYDVCEGESGVCRYLRQDLNVRIIVRP